MADYRKSLMDMTPEERAEVAPGFVPSDDVSTPLSVKVADEAISLATPIDSIVEIQEELAKEEPDYLKIGMLGGMEAIGLLAPGAGKAAQSMIRKGADMARQTDNVVDVASNIPQVSRSVTPSYTDEALLEADEILAEWGKGNLTNPQLRKAMSDKGFKIETKTISPKMTADNIEVVGPDGNIVRWKDMPRGTGAIDTTKSSVEAAGLTDEAIDAWREANATSPEFRKALKGRNEELMDLAAGVKEGRVFNTTYWKRADELRPIRKVTEVPKPATVQDTVSALDKGKRQSPIVGLNYDIPDGDIITARLDIPAYVDYDVWIPTLRHSGKTMYKPALRMKNVKFIQPEGRESGMALDVAVGPQRLKDEFGLADKKAKAKGNKSPFAVMEGEYVKSTDDEAYEYATSIFDSDEWTQAGYDPTKRGFFYDRETGEAILSGDEVVQVGHLVLVKNAEKINPEVFGFSEGGMAMDEQMDVVFKSSRTGYAEGGEVGTAPDTTIGVDPVSGNEVPMGATPEEVRDDIPAQLSEGEYVVPADVVRYFGVKFFEDLRAEAKQGWASMEANGRVGGEPVEATGMEMGQDELPFDISELQVVEMNEGGYLGGYDEGGTTTSPTGDPFATNTITTKKYVDGQGNVRYVTFSGDTPLSYIPPEFKLEGTEEEAPTQTTATAAPVQEDTTAELARQATEGTAPEFLKRMQDHVTFKPETATFSEYEQELKNAQGGEGSIMTGFMTALLGPGAGYGASKLISNEQKKKLEQLQKDADARAQAAKETEDENLMKQFSKLSGEIGDVLEAKETKTPFGQTLLGDLIGWGKDNDIGLNEENKGKFSGMLDNFIESFSRGNAYDSMYFDDDGGIREGVTSKGATQDWIDANTQSAAARKSGDIRAEYEANMARAAASRAATKAKQAETGWTGFFSPPKKDKKK